MRNLKLAFRTLFKTPFVTIIAVLSLALGIGANAAIFSMFDEMLLRPLPVSHPERLVNLSSPGPRPGSTSCNQAGSCDDVFSYKMFRDLERQTKAVFSGVAAHVLFGTNLAYHNQTTSGQALLVSGSYFPTLAIQPALGRLINPSDDETIGANYVAVLSYTYWDTKLGASPSVLNDKIIVNGLPMTIIGVAPPGFEGTTLGANPSVFVPLTMRGQMVPGWKNWDRRNAYWAYLFARLKPGVTIERAQSVANGVYKPIINDVEAPLQKGLSEQGMKRFRAMELKLEDGRKGQSSMHQETKTPLLLLFGITGIVLLIACANIANLLLARAANRSMEMAVRLSLGATRRQLLGQLLTESCLLAFLGGAVSLVVARWTLSLIMALLPNDGGSSLHFALHLSAVWFAAVLSLGTGLLFGIFPALHSTRPDLVTALRNNSGKISGARSAARFRNSLVVVQIALSMALLVSAGLFIKSLRNVSRVDLGVKIDNVVTFGISPSLNGYTNVRSAQLFERVEEELGALPGVTGVAAGRVPLLAGSNWGTDVSVEGFKKTPDTDANARFNEVSAGYFKVLGVPILSGREFTKADGRGAPEVAIVNETFAKHFGLGRDAVGKRMGDHGNDSLNILIVGLVADAKYSAVKDKIPPLFFTPYAQDTTLGDNNFYVRSQLPSDQVLKTIQGVMKRLDPNLPLENLKTMPQQVKENVFLDRIISMLTAAFALVATLLAAVGLYGVLAYTVAQRTREIGVRMALGADAGRVRLMVLRQVGLLTLVGGIIGIAGALLIGQGARSLLFGLEGHDPAVFALSCVVLALVGFLAGYLPARKASRVDPMHALRYE